MYQSATLFQSAELTADELAMVTAGMGSTGSTGNKNSNIGFSWPTLSSCDVCGSGIGVLGIAGSGLGPFISAFNTETFYNITNNMTNNINLNIYIVVPH